MIGETKMATKSKTTSTTSNSKLELDIAILNELVNVNQNYEVQQYDNGFLLEIGGHDYDDNWTNRKLVVNSETELFELIKVIHSLPKDR